MRHWAGIPRFDSNSSTFYDRLS